MNTKIEIRIWANINGAGELTKGIESPLLTQEELVALDRDDCRTFPRDFYTIDFKNKAIVCSLHTTWNAPVCRDFQLSISLVIPRGYKIEKINTYFGNIKAALTQWANEKKNDIEAGIALSSLQSLLDKLAGDIKVAKEQKPFTDMNADLPSSNTGVVVYTHSDEVNQLLEDVYRRDYVSHNTIFVVSQDNYASFCSMKQIILSTVSEQKYKVYFPDYKGLQELCTISSEHEEINFTCKKSYYEDIILKGTIADNFDKWLIERDDNNFSYKIGLTFRPITKTYNVIVNPIDKTSYVRLANNVNGIWGNGTLTFTGEALNIKPDKRTFVLDSSIASFSFIDGVIINDSAQSITITIKDSSLYNGGNNGSGKRNNQGQEKYEKQMVTFVWSKHLKVTKKHPIRVFQDDNTLERPIKEFNDGNQEDVMLDPSQKDITVTFDGYREISRRISTKQFVFLDFERTTKSKFLRVVLPIIILGLLLLYMGYGVGRYIPRDQDPTPKQDTAIAQLKTNITNLNKEIHFLNDSITKLNQKINDLQSMQNKASQGEKGNNKQDDAKKKNKATAEAAIDKLNDIGFTWNDLDAAKNAAEAAGMQSDNQKLFNACQQLLAFCTDANGRKSDPDLLKRWVDGTYPGQGKFTNLPQDIQDTLTTFVNDKYNRYTQLKGKYASLKIMIKNANE